MQGDSVFPIAPADHTALGTITNFGFLKGNGPDVVIACGIAIQLGKGTENTEMSGWPVIHFCSRVAAQLCTSGCSSQVTFSKRMSFPFLGLVKCGWQWYSLTSKVCQLSSLLWSVWAPRMTVRGLCLVKSSTVGVTSLSLSCLGTLRLISQGMARRVQLHRYSLYGLLVHKMYYTCTFQEEGWEQGALPVNLPSQEAEQAPTRALGTFGPMLLLSCSRLHRPMEFQGFLNQDISLSSTSPAENSASGRLVRTLGMCRSPSQPPR